MTLGITGGTGFIGQALQAAASKRNYDIVLFSRHPESISGSRAFTTTTIPNVRGCDQLIHLAGESIFGLWTKEKRRRILESRRAGTRRLVEGIAAAPQKPSVLVSASAVGYYGDCGETLLDENAAPGSGFLSEVTQVWEEEAMRAELYGVRVVCVRTGMVLGRGGGAMKILLPLFRWGLGATLGSGQQWMSCIHLQDHVALLLYCCENPALRGPINAVMPHPTTNAAFTKTVNTALGQSTFLRVPAPALKMGLGELSTLVLHSQRVHPTQALKHGFYFQYPTVEKAVREIV